MRSTVLMYVTFTSIKVRYTAGRGDELLKSNILTALKVQRLFT